MLIKFPSETVPKEITVWRRLYEKRQSIFFATALLVTSISMLSYFVKQKGSSEEKYFRIHSLLSEIQGGKALDIGFIANALTQFPECSPSFDQYLVQNHLLNHEEEKAAELYEKIDARLSAFMNPLFIRFVKASFLMQGKKYSEAYILSKALLSEIEEANETKEYPEITKWLKQRVQAIESNQIVD